MAAGEVKRSVVELQEERLKVSQRVLFAEQAPDTFSEVGITIVKLDDLHFGKLRNQGFIDDEVLLAVLSRRLVLMFADALPQELRHPEVRIAQQSRNARDGSHHLSIERLIGSAPFRLTYKTFTIMQYILIVALEFVLAFTGVALLIRYYNHKA